MTRVTLDDGLSIHCLVKSEAVVLDHHVQGYFHHGIAVGPEDVVVDVGANIGVFGIRAVQRHPTVRVFAFEPIPSIFHVLKKNSVLHGDGRLTALPYGLSVTTSSATLLYYPKSPALSTAHPEFWDNHPEMLAAAVEGTIQNPPPRLRMARFLPRALSHWLARRLRTRPQTVRCELRTLSSVIDEFAIDRIDLLKIDCEGAEFDVLQGIDPHHWPRVRAVVAEVHDVDGRLQKVIEHLTHYGIDQIVVEQEAGLERTVLRNVFATRSQAVSESPSAASPSPNQ